MLIEIPYDISSCVSNKMAIFFQALSTNMLYYSGYKLGAMMGKELGMEGKEIHDLEEKATLLKATTQKR